ncbi:hypothetical protein BUALT_Bualt02G0223800 [Buddleja alternifolia]|uniref:Isopenicillin N synthase-like Fe(2+) 2OG dioxygenase domain-containing protein n=1 Tax=Buddleja alternifolia TaxID=168488 RepID=A0AAV6Y967_9LAMI|nr:hypothetical protein BUALT_Bualt02G0223800 [Buddleja alternifolia]
MPPAATVIAQCDRMPMAVQAVAQQPQPPASEAFAKDAIIAWFRGEFAAANAIIDALCGQLTQLEGGATAADYESVFAAIHQRRLNWIPILQMQKYYSIADVTLELKKVAEKKREDVKSGGCTATFNEKEEKKNLETNPAECDDNGGGDVVDEDFTNSHENENTNSGSQEVQHLPEHVNVVRGLKLYEDIFTDVELSKLNDFVNELRVAGQNGELSGGSCYIEPIPPLLEGVTQHLIQWRLIPENKKPNSCIINFFDKGEYSQPFLKPPHLDQPLSTLLLSESTMAFGRMLVSDGEGNFRGPLMLSLKEGSLLVMRGNSSDTARHVMCSSPNKRISITFFRVRTDRENHLREKTPLSKAMTLWQPGNVPNPYTMSNTDMIPKWGVVRAPMVMLAPVGPMVLNSRRMPNGGTGVFLPWNVGPRKPTKHLPPRAQRGRFLALPSPADTHKPETTSDSGVISP